KESESVTVLNDFMPSDAAQTSLESNLNQLSLEMLRFVCCGMGLEESLEEGSWTGNKAQHSVLGEGMFGTYGKQSTVSQNFQLSCAWDRKDFGYKAESGPYVVRVDNENSWKVTSKVAVVD
ncbi:8391_t:CDS:2, partial [Racocetra persica]